MNVENQWKILHEYKRLAEEGTVLSLQCPLESCKSPLTSMRDKENDDKPYLECFFCSTKYPLEDTFFENMENIVHDARTLRQPR